MIRKALIDPKVKHQSIGGKEIIIEREMTIGDILDGDVDMSIALYNFMVRREDFFTLDYDLKVYYGHVGFLGYFVAEDEIIEWLD